MLFMQEDTQLTAIFPDLERYLTGANAPMRVAGSHGLLCARYCTQGKPDFQEWVEAIIGPVNEADLTMQSCSQQLLLVFEKTSRVFEESMHGLELLLPDDASSLQERSRAFSDWCNGFIAGLGLSGLHLDESTEPEVKEVLSDLLEFTQMEDLVDETEENELAYMEIVEYTRLAVVSLGLILRHRDMSETLH